MCDDEYEDSFNCPYCGKLFDATKITFLGALTKDITKHIQCPECNKPFVCEREAIIVYKYRIRKE